MSTCMEFSSASLYTATVLIPIFLAVFMTRQAISPLLAMTTFLIALGPKEETHPKSDQLTNIRNVTEGGRVEFEEPIPPSPLGKHFFLSQWHKSLIIQDCQNTNISLVESTHMKISGWQEPEYGLTFKPDTILNQILPIC